MRPGRSVDAVVRLLEDGLVEAGLLGLVGHRGDERLAVPVVDVADRLAEADLLAEHPLGVLHVTVPHRLEQRRGTGEEVVVAGLERLVEGQLVLVEHRLEGVEGRVAELAVVDHHEEVDVLAAESAAGKRLLAGEEPLEGGPEDELVVVELDLDVAGEVLVEPLPLGDPRLEDVEHLGHDAPGLVEGAGVHGVLHHLLLHALHAAAEELASLLLGHLLAVGLHLLDLGPDLPHPLAHPLAHVAHRAAAHEGLHHRPAEVHQVPLHGLAARSEDVVVVVEKGLDDRSLAVGEAELLDEERHVPAAVGGLEELADLPHAAHASHATPPASPALGLGGPGNQGRIGDRVDDDVAGEDGGDAGHEGRHTEGPKDVHGSKPLLWRGLPLGTASISLERHGVRNSRTHEERPGSHPIASWPPAGTRNAGKEIAGRSSRTGRRNGDCDAGPKGRMGSAATAAGAGHAGDAQEGEGTGGGDVDRTHLDVVDANT